MARAEARGVQLRFSASPANQRTLALLGPRLPRLARGWMPWLRLARYPLPQPGPGWVRLRPRQAGICGTDLALLTGRASPILSPFNSFPAVLGHEVVGEIDQVGEGVDGWTVGQRVVVEPLIGCVVRGLTPCSECAAGRTAFCLRPTEGALAPGMLIGYCRDLPGTWSSAMLVHESQLRAVPEVLPDEVAVLVEPFSVALHAVLASPPAAGERVLVVGAGTIGLCVTAALRLVRPAVDLTVLARHPLQRELAAELGATRVPGEGSGSAIESAERHAGARRHRSLLGETVLTGGFERVFDCVGSRHSLADALRVAAPGATVALVGAPGRLPEMDWTLVWARELRIHGTYVYGPEESLPGRRQTMDEALRLLAAHPQLPLGRLVTHRFPLERWREALRTSLDRRAGTVKVVFASGPNGT